MKAKLVIRDLTESNIDDVFRVCSNKPIDDPSFTYGINLKRKWMKKMLKEIGPITKIAYVNMKPVAQLMFYPETALPYDLYPRANVIRVECAYNPFPERRGKGIGDALMKSLVDDCHKGLKCLDDKQCRFLVANPFNTGEGTSLEEYYKRNGFQKGENELYLPINSEYEPKKKQSYKPFEEDKDKALVFYNRNCEYSYRFAEKARRSLNEIIPDIEIEMIDVWEKPEKSASWGNEVVVVNATPIKSFIGNSDEFKTEILKAIKSSQSYT